MANVVSKVLWVSDNWRSVNYENNGANPWNEVQLESGEWQWPDCGWICQHCKQCLGCTRKCINEPDSQYIKCENSPNGLHLPVVNDDDNE